MSEKRVQLSETVVSLEPVPRDKFFVARKIEPNEHHIGRFTRHAALRLGKYGLVRTHNALHVTVGNGAMRGGLIRLGYEPGDILDFATRLRGMIQHNFGHTSGDVLMVDPSMPLLWMGRGVVNKLALNVTSPLLVEQREAVDEYYRQQTGQELSEPFVPHVTFVGIQRRLAGEFSDRPLDLLDEALIPRKLGTQCLSVYSPHVHPRGLVWSTSRKS